MKDGIISGTGNSRYLKTVPNALTLYPTWEAALTAMVAGTFPIDFNGINPAGWEQLGDKLGKETLLTDALCTALGLSTTATPTQAMDKLRTLVNTAQSGVNGKVGTETGTYVGTSTNNEAPFGTVTLNFSFSPKIIVIFYMSGTSGNELAFYFDESGIVPMAFTTSYQNLTGPIRFNAAYASKNGNSITFTSSDPSRPLVNNGRTYHYIAIG